MIVIKRKAIVPVNLCDLLFCVSSMFLPDLCQEDYPLKLKLNVVDQCWCRVIASTKAGCLKIMIACTVNTLNSYECKV